MRCLVIISKGKLTEMSRIRRERDRTTLFFIILYSNPLCLICNKILASNNEYIPYKIYEIKHAKYSEYTGHIRFIQAINTT